jgi:hypothetical protein
LGAVARAIVDKAGQILNERYKINRGTKNMKKVISLVSVVAILAAPVLALAQDSGNSPAPAASASPAAKQYTCSMHPEVVQDKPGNCPKCGMKLVEKKEEKPKS